MTLDVEEDRELQNENAYDDLVGAIEASDGILSLLIAVCDDSGLRDQIIDRYEAELQSQMRCYRLPIIRGEPSLRQTIAQAVQGDQYLEQGGRAVFTVTGAEQLFFLKLGQERSEQEIFFGYLQWTREGLREFPYPIVLWVTNQLLKELSKKAPDFWSWRKGVFRFISHKKSAVLSQEIAEIHPALEELRVSGVDAESLLPLEDLQALIQHTEQQRGTQDPLLASLYSGMGLIYARRVEQGEAQDYQAEQTTAVKYFHKAANLQKSLELRSDLANSLRRLAFIYKAQGRYKEAEPLYLQTLELRKSLLGEEHPDIAQSLYDLAALYHSQGRYKEAELLYLQALELRKSLLGEEHPDVAQSMHNLAVLYSMEGRYREAEPLHKQALELRKKLLGEEHLAVAQSLSNLATHYKSQGYPGKAEILQQQALKLRKKLLGEEHPDVAISLHSLASLYSSQKRYEEAEPLYQQALRQNKRLLGQKHPAVASNLNNLASLYSSQKRYEEAEPLYQQALELFNQTLGMYHPYSNKVRGNLAVLRNMIAFQKNSTSDTES